MWNNIINNFSSILDEYFNNETMSVHFRENNFIYRKVWFPWNWKLEKVEKFFDRKNILELIEKLSKELDKNEWFLEIDRKFSKVFQLGRFRIVIVLSPLSNAIEITVVKPIKKLNLNDYNLDQVLLDDLANNSRWILISWSPWEWKTTFAQALVELYVDNNKIVKTIEAPRDLIVPNQVTQYSFSHWTHNEIRDILLLSRPDFTIFDEVRNLEDFQLFKDLRLTWIWLIWVIHANSPIDWLQRFLWNIELWIIPQVVDTIIFIKWWKINKILKLNLTVKLPEWMESNDLSRPVVQVIDFEKNIVYYEIYSFWEEIMVIDLEKIEKRNPDSNKLHDYSIKYLNTYLTNLHWFNIDVEINWENCINIYVPEKHKWKIIWKWWENINKLEEKLWLRINVKPSKDIVDWPIEENSFKKKKKKKNKY